MSKAKEQKLTPFKYACQVYAKDIEYCPAEKDKDYECENGDGHVKYETCADCIEHYIKERATIPDGWDVLRDVFKKVQDAREISTTTQPKARAEASYWAYEYVEKIIKEAFQENGKEL